MKKTLCVAMLSILIMAAPFSAFAMDANIKMPANVQGSDASNDIQLQAAEMLRQGQNAEARKLILSRIQEKATSADNNFSMYYMLAFIDNQSEDYKAAIKDLQATLKAEESKASPNLRTRVELMKRIGDAYYDLRELKPALAEYQDALLMTKSLPDKDALKPMLLEAVVGTLTRQKSYSDAETYAKQLVQATAARSNSGHLADVGAWFWSQLELLGIYKKNGNDAERLALRKSLKDLLDKLLTVRSQMEDSGALPDFEEIRHEFLTEYLSENPPSCLADYLWLALNWRAYSLPLIRWQPDNGVTPKAAILCIHGMGLENRSFSPFAHDMTKRGYVVYALDIRGFGSWLAIQGQEDLSFSNAIADIGSVLGFIKECHDQVPVYLLGESMGGGIALRAGIQYANDIAGIVSSVPSAERFQQRKMSLQVALHFLRDKDRPFDIGSTVTKQATSNEDLRHAWETDPKAKMNMSPVELIKFAVFMRTTTEQCKKIASTPVFIVQGLKDKLVKPAGTYQIFDNIQADNKVMLIIGNAEHLIFESNMQNKQVVDSLCSWLENNSPH